MQVAPGEIGPLLDAIHDALDGWLGRPQWGHSEGRVTLRYRFDSADEPPIRLRLKVEINSREHFTVLGHGKLPFEVKSRWFAGSASIHTYELDELLGTKLRALYQRKKGRDLFDLAHALRREGVSADRVVHCFLHYMAQAGARITRAMFEENLAAKRGDTTFAADMTPLLAPGQDWRFDDAFDLVSRELVARLPGDPWKLA